MRTAVRAGIGGGGGGGGADTTGGIISLICPALWLQSCTLHSTLPVTTSACFHWNTTTYIYISDGAANID